MNAPIVSRQLIATQAARAAQLHARSGAGAPPPPNPYCEHFEPEHHLEWAASFKRSLHHLQAPEAESCA